MQFKAEPLGEPGGVLRATLLVPFLVVFLTTFGLIALFSAGYSMSLREPLAAVTRQLMYVPLAALAGWLAWRVDLEWLRAHRLRILGAVVFLLVLARIPGIGRMVNGSWRWIDLGVIRLQPSDLAKVALVLLVADAVARNQRRTLPLAGPAWRLSARPPYVLTRAAWEDLLHGYLAPMGWAALLCAFIGLGPDLGTIVLCGTVALAMVHIGRARLRYIAATVVVGAAGFYLLVVNWPSRLRRFFSFLDPEGRQMDESYQLYQGMLAFAVGGVGGAGPGNGLQQRAYLPEAHTDFVFTIIGEEWGLFATAGVAAVYLGIFLLVLRDLRRATDLFRMTLALGCVLFITLQALVNMCVVTGLLPTKGIALPFISYGGTNLVASSVLVGLMLNALRDGGLPDLRPGVYRR
jgi:cell division protein FtsW